MRILAGVLVALIVAIQYPLWLGKGGWMRVWDVDRQLEAQGAKNARLELRNSARTRSRSARATSSAWSRATKCSSSCPRNSPQLTLP
jgi:hypothetical protein